MADQRSKRYSPPASRMSTLPNFGSLSPIGQSNGPITLDVFRSPDTLSQLPGLSPTMDKRNNHRNSEPSETPGRYMIRIRRLPRNFTDDALRSMLVFATDLDEAKFVQASESSSLEESGFISALAVFNTEAGAIEARKYLHGKSMDKGGPTLIVELVPSSQSAYNGSRRNTVDGTALRQQNNTSGGSNGTNLPENTLSRQSSRFTSSFQQSTGSQVQQGMNPQKINSPLTSPLISTAHTYDFPAPDSSNRLQGLFSPQSPVANAYTDHTRISGKSLINDGNDDDETGELLKDPIGYAQNGRKPSTYDSFVPQFGSLSLDTNTSPTNGNNPYSQYVVSPSSSNYVSPRSVRSPPLPTPSRGPTVGTNGAYPSRNLNLKHDYPPVNPADQNPPCNTLYVGNLPVNTSEDELKSLFSKSRGFKRLCFRTKQNGPMCFVEYEDITYASHALHELYGVQLHNSYKGGIRVSFSKNPLGVRSDSRPVMNSHTGQPGYGNGMGPPSGFSTAAGPPPGLMAPGMHAQQTHAPPPMQNNAGRGYAPQYRGISPQSHLHQGTNGYHQPPRNLSSGQYAHQPAFGSMNSFMANPLDGNYYSNGNNQNGINGHNGR
jgi:hypothetical protein